MKELSKSLIVYLVKFRHRLSSKSFVIDLFTEVMDRPSSSEGLVDGDIFVEDGVFKYVDDQDMKELGKISEPLVEPDDIFRLDRTMIANYNGPPIDTTVGVFTLNASILEGAAGEIIPYRNDVWNSGWLESIIADGLRDKTLTVAQAKAIINRTYRSGMFSDIIVPTATEKSFTTDDKVAKRKLELLDKYAGQLNDPLIVKKIEDELIDMDRKFVEGDDASGFYDAMGSNSYSLHRKKMFLTIGGIESFDTEETGYEFIMNALREGWNPEDFAIMVNELRKGSHLRGDQTKLGGALAKAMQRIFQNLMITENDCGSKQGIDITFTDDNIESYIGRTVFSSSGLAVIDKSTKSRFVGNTMKMRSPMTCKTANGLCYVCCGEIFKQLDQRGISMEATSIAYTFQTQAMKAMHGTSIDTKKIDIDKFLVENITG